ncbi:MAG: tetratricopeptide repeat protein [Gammaproteobacteria bacterium]|nr:tetratricopeptide repeat protein [Gammaproteobacteria bacterium]
MEGYSSEREQVEAIQKWWKDHGKSIVLGLAVGLLGLGGYRYWEETRNLQAESASINYEKFLNQADDKTSKESRVTGQAILDNYAASIYARLTALTLAKLAIDDAQPEQAKKHLQWVIDHPGSDQLAEIARARLAQLSLADGKADAAWALLVQGGLNTGDQLAELKADILAAQGKTAEAVVLYAKAQKLLTEGGGNPAVIELKLERLGQIGQVGVKE